MRDPKTADANDSTDGGWHGTNSVARTWRAAGLQDTCGTRPYDRAAYDMRHGVGHGQRRRPSLRPASRPQQGLSAPPCPQPGGRTSERSPANAMPGLRHDLPRAQEYGIEAQLLAIGVADGRRRPHAHAPRAAGRPANSDDPAGPAQIPADTVNREQLRATGEYSRILSMGGGS